METIKQELLESEDASGRRRSSRVRKPATPPKDSEEETKKTKKSPRGKRTPTKVEDEDEDEDVSEDEDEAESEEAEEEDEEMESEVETKKSGKDQIYHCGYCKVDYNTDPSIKRHWRQRHPEVEYNVLLASQHCKLCNRKFENQRQFAVHMARQHFDYWQFDQWGKLVKNGQSVAVQSINEETNTGVLDEITKERPFSCELCGKDFVNKVGFQNDRSFYNWLNFKTNKDHFENLSKNRLTNHKEHVHGFYERPNTSRRRMSARQLLDEISDDQTGASTNQGLAADEDKENTSEENHKDNYCYVCNRQFENKTGFTVHMTRQHSHNSNNSNNSNNIEPSSKRFKGDGKYISKYAGTVIILD